jgi:hypothetical protein
VPAVVIAVRGGITLKEEARQSGRAYQCGMLGDGGFEVHKARLFRR